MKIMRFIYKLFIYLQKFSEKKVKQLEQKIAYKNLTKVIKKNWSKTRFINSENGMIILVKNEACNPSLEELLMNPKNLSNALNNMMMPKSSFEYTSIVLNSDNVNNQYLQSILQPAGIKVTQEKEAAIVEEPTEKSDEAKKEKPTTSTRLYSRKTY